MINNMLYYILYTSAVLFYGIGLNRAAVLCQNMKGHVLKAVKSLITVTSSSVLTYLLCDVLLVPYGLSEVYPFVAALIFISISVFCESLIRITARVSAAEFSISLLSILLSVNEGCNLLNVTEISVCCILAFYIFVPLLHAIQHRIESGRPSSDFKNSSLLFFSIAIIILALFAWNVSWLNPGVMQ
ncbi:MAG: hypothetical protein K6F69_04860 [Treponema sp.]|nr:hypothetical protein [Treponema sp.]